MRLCELHDLGRVPWDAAYALQRELLGKRKQNAIADRLLIVEHPHVITMGRNGRLENLLAGDDVLARAGIAFHQTDRGGDVTYHGPGQIVGYPILDLREWKRDVVAYVRGLEQVLIDALARFEIHGERSEGATGVWVGGSKIAAIGVHISRWVTSHGFALNVDTNLEYFRYIVPCGLTRPVTSMRALHSSASRNQVIEAIADCFAGQFGYELVRPAAPVSKI